MDRLSGLDASFLYLETPEQLMHVCGLIVLDPATMPEDYSFDAMKAEIDNRVRDVPTFTRKLRKVPLKLDHPIWVRDTHFDIDRHVHRMALPQPGGYEELVELCGHIAGQPLDRSRPLWEMWVIEGYDDDKIAVFTKMHHATVDGVSGSNLVSHLCSLEPDAPPLAEGGDGRYGRDPRELELLGRALVSNLTKPVAAVRLMAPSTQLITRTLGRAREGTAMAAPFSAPRTSFNGTITSHRTVGLADMSLDDVKAVKKDTGTTVNDVVLAVAGGALRSYLEDRGELPSNSLLATVPVSVRESSQRSEGANKVSALFAKLGTDIEDPLERMRTIYASTQSAKELTHAVRARRIQSVGEVAPPLLLNLASRAAWAANLSDRIPVVAKVVVSNVPGPPFPVYSCGARVSGIYAASVLLFFAGLNITLMSYIDRLDFGLTSDPDLLDDPWEIADGIKDALAELMEALDLGKPTPVHDPFDA